MEGRAPFIVVVVVVKKPSRFGKVTNVATRSRFSSLKPVRPCVPATVLLVRDLRLERRRRTARRPPSVRGSVAADRDANFAGPSSGWYLRARNDCRERTFLIALEKGDLFILFFKARWGGGGWVKKYPNVSRQILIEKPRW